MATIIAKRVRNVGLHGIIKPLMKKGNNGIFKSVDPSEFRNGGEIFVPAGYASLNDELFEFEEEALQRNPQYEQQLEGFQSGTFANNPCRFLLAVNPNTIKKVAPIALLPIYDKYFSPENNLVDSTGITAPFFFLSYNSFIYGPFEKDGNILKPADFATFSDDYDFYDEYNKIVILKISEETAQNYIETDNEKRRYLSSFKDFVTQQIGELIDYSSIEELSRWIGSQLDNTADFNAALRKMPTITGVLNNIQMLNLKALTKLDEIRWTRYKNIIKNYENNYNVEQEIIDLVVELNNLQGSNLYEDGSLVSSAELENEKETNARLKNQMLNYLEKLKEAQDIINEGKGKIKQLEQKNEIVAKIIKMPQGETFLQSIANTKDFSTLIQVSSHARTVQELINDAQKLKEEISQKEQEITTLNRQQYGLETAITQIQSTFNNQIKLNTNLVEAKLYNDILNGIEYAPTAQKAAKIQEVNIENDTLLSSAKEYILSIQERLKEQGRNLAFNEVANLAITIQQSFITVFAGAPGVGKTSLVEKLAKSYGLSNDYGYLEIPCARGWTSSKDLLGFYNPLTKKYQSSKTGLRDALEQSALHKNSPYFILLDEANLSPIEHYWSDFIKLADFDYERKIRFADKEIAFGGGLKFMATINYDHTTEMLSNRLIDRAAIIIVEQSEIGENRDLRMNEIYDWHKMEKFFGINKNSSASEVAIKVDVEASLAQIEKISNLTISPRKKIAVENYCKIATGLLEGESKISLDYAVCQHILPMINLRGEQHIKSLEVLKKHFEDYGMIKSQTVLERIITKGKDFNHFRYLYY